jgi:hypothetical protein
MLNEPFAGIEIWLKDSKNVINISRYDYIELNMIVLNSDSSNGPFMLHSHSRLKHPEYLRGKDTLSCDHPKKEPNSRYAYSVKYTEIPVQKNELIYRIDINSLKTPTWYVNNGVTYVEEFDKERFFSLCIQTGSNFPLNKEYNVIISSISLKKNKQVQPNVNSSSVNKGHQLILILSIISSILYVLVITLLFRIRYKGKAKTGDKKQIIIPSSLSTDTQPVPTQPVPTQPVPTQPVPTQPVPTQPVPTQPVKADNTSNSSDTVSTITTDTTGIIIRPAPPLPLDSITINVLRKIAENPKLSTDDVARDNNKDSSTICKRIDRDFGKGITISKLRLYFTALDIRNKNTDIDCNELHNHANKVITDAHGKLNSYKDLQDISAILQKKCPADMLDFFKKKYGDIQF